MTERSLLDRIGVAVPRSLLRLRDPIHDREFLLDRLRKHRPRGPAELLCDHHHFVMKLSGAIMRVSCLVVRRDTLLGSLRLLHLHAGDICLLRRIGGYEARSSVTRIAELPGVMSVGSQIITRSSTYVTTP